MNDYTKDLTVFHITCGASSLVKSRKSLLDQTCKFNLVTIKDIQPIWKAFQFMHTNCKTPFFIQVDEDMILNKDAVEIMYNAIKKENKFVALHWFCLYDVHLEQIISGIKIYRSSWCVGTHFKNEPHFDGRHAMRLRSRGAHVKGSLNANRVVGKHGAHYTDEEIYVRYRKLGLYQKFASKDEWKKDAFFNLFKKMNLDPKSKDFWAFIGWISGFCQDISRLKARDASEKFDEVDYIKQLFKERGVDI